MSEKENIELGDDEDPDLENQQMPDVINNLQACKHFYNAF